MAELGSRFSGTLLARTGSIMQKPEVKNPFLSDLSFKLLPWYEKLKVVLMLPIGLIRFICFVLSILLGCLFGRILTINLTKKEETEPFGNIRRMLQRPIIAFARVCLFCSGFHWIKVKGKVASSVDAPIIVAAPHTSFLDALVVAFIGRVSAVSKIENEDLPFLGNVVRAFEPISVARSEQGSKNQTIKEIQRRARSAGKWPPVLIFPEGTCTNGKCLITFKPGAFYPGLPIQPVTLKYNNKRDVTSWTWTGPSLIEQLAVLFSQFHNYMEVEFLPVYRPSCEESQDAKLFGRNVRAAMARALNIPTTDHAFEDCRLMLQAHKNHLPMEAGLIEYEKLRHKLGMNLDNMKDLLQKFAEMDTDSNGQVTVEEFSKYLKLPVTPEIEALFRIYDRDESGFIDFREYVIGLALVSEPLNSEETIRLAFSVFDVDKTGLVTEQGLRKILQTALPHVTDLDARCIFRNVDKNGKGVVSYDEFREFALSRPEYALLFTHFHKLRTADDEQASYNSISSSLGQEVILPNAVEPLKT